MCGIAGRLGGNESDDEQQILQRLHHRGPDDRGEAKASATWLGHVRLSIVDVEGGHQPLGAHGQRLLVGNGEIYNHADVRRQLGSDVHYDTRSDNEVALRLIERRGPEALGELEGMYAVLSAQADGSGFVAARDPVGIKPLYWTPPGACDDGGVRFASELAAFEKRWRPAIESFPPGHAWTAASPAPTRFADVLPDATQVPASIQHGAEPDDAIRTQIRTALVDAVHGQMLGDVPIGVFLSGGLDSTLVAAIAARWYEARGEQLQTFAVGIEGAADLLAARRAAAVLRTRHRERVYTAAEARAAVGPVVRAIEHFDPSLVRSAVPNYLLAQMAAQHVKVVLTGEGADELFAGYAYYHADIAPRALHAELLATVRNLHGLNLQRADRTTMAFSLEARVPFLDRALIALAMRIPAAWKEARHGVPEKRLLRQAFHGWLPHDLLWRKKVQFGDGSGAADVLTDAIAQTVSDADFARERGCINPPLRSKEELAYYRIWHAHLDGIVPEKTLTRFATV